jgi:hypothetical protein
METFVAGSSESADEQSTFVSELPVNSSSVTECSPPALSILLSTPSATKKAEEKQKELSLSDYHQQETWKHHDNGG